MGRRRVEPGVKGAKGLPRNTERIKMNAVLTKKVSPYGRA